MKKQLIVFALAAALLLTVSGCGKKDTGTDTSTGTGTNNNGTVTSPGGTAGNGTDTQNGSGTDTQSGTNNNTGTDTDTATGTDADTKTRQRANETLYGNGMGDNYFAENEGSTFGHTGIDGTTEPFTDTTYDGQWLSAAQQTATWQQMLDNGRVRDTDGDLLDGENAAW